MKKMISLLLALLLATMCLPAFAEEAAPTQEYTHPTLGFSITLPAEWLIVDSTNVQAYIDAYESGEMTYSGTNAQTLTQIVAQLAATDGTMIIDPYANNIMIAASNIGISLTNDLFVALMIPQLETEIASAMPGIEITSSGNVVAFGENEFITVSAAYNMMGITVSLDQLYLLDGAYMYVFNLTATNAMGQENVDAFYAAALEILTSLTLPEAISVF